MKKIGIVLVVMLVCFLQNVSAKTFNFERNKNYKYQLIWQKGTTILKKQISMYKITDDDGVSYYNVQPNTTMFVGNTYTKKEVELDEKTYRKIARIAYYGYGYKNHNTEEYYVATQYLIFQELGPTSVEIIDTNGNTSDFAAKEIQEINKILEENKFISKEYEIDGNQLIIDDPYIMEHYTLEGNDLEIEKTDTNYKINFLAEKTQYTVELKSKTNCLPANYWAAATSANVLGRGELCEDDSIILVNRIKKEEITKKENAITDENKENIIIEDEIEVDMPSTAKFNCNCLFFLLTIGNLYYVCKK